MVIINLVLILCLVLKNVCSCLHGVFCDTDETTFIHSTTHFICAELSPMFICVFDNQQNYVIDYLTYNQTKQLNFPLLSLKSGTPVSKKKRKDRSMVKGVQKACKPKRYVNVAYKHFATLSGPL